MTPGDAPPHIHETTACDYSPSWLWVHGWVDKRKFKGRCLSAVGRHWSALEGEYEKDQIMEGEVRQGWVLTCAGDLSGCGWDSTIYFEENEPVVIDGRWDGATRYDEDGEEIEGGGDIVDGPHQATWLEIA